MNGIAELLCTQAASTCKEPHVHTHAPTGTELGGCTVPTYIYKTHETNSVLPLTCTPICQPWNHAIQSKVGTPPHLNPMVGIWSPPQMPPTTEGGNPIPTCLPSPSKFKISSAYQSQCGNSICTAPRLQSICLKSCTGQCPVRMQAWTLGATLSIMKGEVPHSNTPL